MSAGSTRDMIDFGYATRTLRGRWFSTRVHLRVAVVSAVLLTVAIVFAAMSIRFGAYPLSVPEIARAFAGVGDDFVRLIVFEWRMPIAAAALAFGAVLGIGGAIFQSLTRNPLGSPDVIGFDAGSYTAVVVTVLLFNTRDYWSLATAAIVGGILTAFVVYVLSYRGGVQGFRLIIVGIGIAAMLGSINSYLLIRAEIEDAMAVGFWGAGSISRVSWSSMVPALLLVGLIVLLAALLSPALRRLEFGDDAAITQGTRVGPARLALIVVGVSTTALVTAAAGPLGFIALVAPQLARRLTRSPGVSLLAAASMGALLLTAAHVLSLVIAEFYRPIPVGLLTVCLGGVYLIGLLVHEARRYRVTAF